MSMIRHIRRNIVKKEIGNNDISETWYRLQVAKYGVDKYCAIRNANRKVNKMSPKRSHKVGPRFVVTNNGIQQVLNG